MLKKITRAFFHPIILICDLRFLIFGYRKVKITVYYADDNTPLTWRGSIKLIGPTFEGIWDDFVRENTALANSGNYTKWKQVIF